MSPDEIIKVCQESEKLGYDCFYYGEGKGIECFSTLSYLASITNKIRIGPGISFVTYHHPAVLARTAAAIDVLSRGRFELRLGAGAVPGYGIAKPSISERTSRLDEGLEIIKKLWQNGSLSYRGQHYEVNNAMCSPTPVQNTIPVTVCAKENKMLRITAKRADIWEAFFPPDVFARKLEQFKEQCDSENRNPDDVEKGIILRVFLGESEDDAKDMMKRYIERRNISTHRLEKTKHRDAIGNPSQCLEKIQQYVDLGVTRFTLLIGDAERIDPLRSFYENVISHFR